MKNIAVFVGHDDNPRYEVNDLPDTVTTFEARNASEVLHPEIGHQLSQDYRCTILVPNRYRIDSVTTFCNSRTFCVFLKEVTD